MRSVFIAAIVLGASAGIVVAAVRVWPSDPGGGSPTPASTLPPATPEQTALAFAVAWSDGNPARMYELLDSGSRLALTAAELAEIYNSFDREVTVEGRRAVVRSVEGARATLDVRLATAYFGTLEYAISLPMVAEGAVYLVRWDPSVMHPELRSGLSVRSLIERPRRGTIFDRSGAILATTTDIRMLGLNRAAVRDRAAVSAAVEGLGFTKEQVDAAFASGLGREQRVPIGPVADALAEKALETLQFVDGLVLYFETQRVHPLGAAAAHAVGYTRELTPEELKFRVGQGYRIGDRIGATGLEAGYESLLAGQIGAQLRIVDSTGAEVRVLASREFRQGEDLMTTLDAVVQRAAFARLGERVGAVVVLDPRTNEVLAAVSSPSFDPDAFERNDAVVLAAVLADSRGPLTNRATAGLYSGGSTFKLVTGAAGLLHGGLEPTDRLMCGATWNGVDPPRRNWEGGQGLLTIAEALMRSCNPVFYEIGLRLYNETDGALSAMARAFGFGAPSGVQGVGEASGLVPDAAWKKAEKGEPWYPGDEVNLSIGQGFLLLTPLQLANAYSTFLADELRTPVLRLGETARSRGGSLGLSAAAYAQVRLGLELVTGPGGTAASVFWGQGYRDFGGKSGTAEDANEQQHVLFVAYAPRAEPRAVAAVVLDDGQSGSLEAGPIARDVVLAALGRP